MTRGSGNNSNVSSTFQKQQQPQSGTSSEVSSIGGISSIFQLLLSTKQLQLFRSSRINRVAYNTWISSFTALRDSDGTKCYNSYSKHNLHTVVINLTSTSVFQYESKLISHGWKVKLMDVSHLASGRVDMTVFEEASCVFLFHNSLTGLNHANKHFITGALERMYVSGNLQRLVGVDLARPMLKTETGRVLRPVPKGATGDVAGAVCDFTVDPEALDDPIMLNALTQEVAREILKSLMQCHEE